MHGRSISTVALAAGAVAALAGCGRGPSPAELASQVCAELPRGVPQEQVETTVQRLADDQGVNLGEQELQQALEEVESRCPEVLEQ